eukprot:g21028.t1
MGAVCATEPVALPLALALQEDDLSERLEALNLAECLEQEAARRARLQAAAFHALLALPELARGLCVLWGLKTSRRFAAGGATATVRWSRLPPMPTARLGCFAAAARSSVYVAGGHAGRGRALAIIERFDVAEYFWELLTNMPSARLGAVSLCWQPSQLRGRDLHLYIFGGHNGQGAVDLAERLELESDGISNPSSLPAKPSRMMATGRPASKHGRYGCCFRFSLAYQEDTSDQDGL